MAHREESVAAYLDALRSTFPAAAKQLRPGLGSDEMRRSAAERGIDLPSELQALYSRADGQKSLQLALIPNPQRAGKGLALATLEFLGAWRDNALGLEMLYRNSTRRRVARDEEVRDVFWSAGWLPFAAGKYEREGIYLKLFLDGEPAAGGREGQVVFETLRVAPDAEHVERRVVGRSLPEFLDGVGTALRGDALLWIERQGLGWRDPA